MVFVEFSGLLIVIMIAAYLLSHGAEVLADKWGTTIAGSLILGLLTTLPEYTFVYWAAVKGRYDMAIGSAIGACTLLVTLGYGLVILVATTKLSRKPVPEIRLTKATRIDAAFLLVTALVALLFVWNDGALSLAEGIILAAVFVAYVVLVVTMSGKHGEDLLHVPCRRLFIALAQILVGGAVIFLVSEPFVDTMIQLAKAFSVSPVVIAIVLGPIASEMPEKMTAYITVWRNGKLAQLSICNFIGSKVNHNSLLLAVIPFVGYAKQHGKIPGLMSPMFLVMTVMTVLVSGMLARGRIQRWHGAVLVACYVAIMIMAMQTTSAVTH
jgi:cation:H+ antiporter